MCILKRTNSQPAWVVTNTPGERAMLRCVRAYIHNLLYSWPYGISFKAEAVSACTHLVYIQATYVNQMQAQGSAGSVYDQVAVLNTLQLGNLLAWVQK